MNVGIYSGNINKLPQKNGFCIYVPVLHLLSVKSWVEFVWNVPRAKILFTSTFNRAEFPVSRGCLVRTTNYIWTCPNCSEIGVLIPRWFHCFEHFNKYNNSKLLSSDLSWNQFYACDMYQLFQFSNNEFQDPNFSLIIIWLIIAKFFFFLRWVAKQF